LTGYDAQLPRGWSHLRFDSFLRRIEQKVELDDATEYSTVGVRLRGRGAYVRDSLLGAQIARKQQWILRANDIVYNKLFAWRGAFAVADESVDGLIVSDKFPTYELDTAIVDASYLRFFFMTDGLATQARRLSKGAAAISKLTLNPPQFWDLTLPVPSSLDVQRRMATVFREVEARALEVQALGEHMGSDFAALRTILIANAVDDPEAMGTLEDVLSEKPRNGWSPLCDNTGGTPVLSLSAVTGFTYRGAEFKTTSLPTNPDAHYWLAPGDLLITRSNTADLVGHAAIYDGAPSPCIYPDLMMRLRVDPSRADAAFVHLWLQGRTAREHLRKASRGTNPTMRKIAQGDVQRIPFPLHLSVGRQAELVRAVRGLLQHVEQAAVARDSLTNNAPELLRAVLKQGFSGRL